MLPGFNKDSLESEIINSQNSILEKKYDAIGAVYFVKVSPDEVEDKSGISQTEATRLLNLIDQDPSARKPNALFNFLVSGNFLLARSDSNVAYHHHLYALSLYRPVTYMQTLWREMKDLDVDQKVLKASVNKIIRSTLAKCLFNLESIPVELDAALSVIDVIASAPAPSFEKQVVNRLSASYFPSVLQSNSNMKALQEKYYKKVTLFLQNQADTVLQELQAYAKGQKTFNMLTLSVLELIQEENDLYRDNPYELKEYLSTLHKKDVIKYLQKPEILALPGSLAGAENLTVLFVNSIAVLQNNPTLLEKLQEVLNKLLSGLSFTYDNLELIKSLFEKDERDNGFLHRFYLELLRRDDVKKSTEELQFANPMMRYTSKALSVGELSIPAESTIVLLPAMTRFNEELYQRADAFIPNRYFIEQPLARYPLSIFNETKRQCPAKPISSFLAKTFIAQYALNLSFDLEQEKKAANAC